MPAACSMSATISRRSISRACCEGRTATRISNKVRGINRVVYDVTSKPARHDRVGVILNWTI
jgi:GMP synthase PP-ATPase subunit